MVNGLLQCQWLLFIYAFRQDFLYLKSFIFYMSLLKPSIWFCGHGIEKFHHKIWIWLHPKPSLRNWFWTQLSNGVGHKLYRFSISMAIFFCFMKTWNRAFLEQFNYSVRLQTTFFFSFFKRYCLNISMFWTVGTICFMKTWVKKKFGSSSGSYAPLY